MPRLHPETTLCIVVDIQERLMPVLHQAESLVEKSRTILQGLHALEIPVIATEQYPKGLGSTVNAVKLLLENAPIFEKTRFSAYTDEVAAALKQHNRRNIILVGAEAHVCMLQTVLDLREAGYDVYIPFECTTSRNPANKENALEQMRDNGAVVSNVESILFELMEDAKHPAFKTISKLIQ